MSECINDEISVSFCFCSKVIIKKKSLVKAQHCNAYLVSLVDGCAADFNPLKEMF